MKSIDNIDSITCDCASDPDLDGTWFADQQKEECRELGYPESDWPELLFSHLFSDYEGWTKEIENAFLNSNVVSIKLMIGFHCVTVTKRFK